MADAPTTEIPALPEDYIVPKIWTWDRPSGGQFANINRPIAGATHDKIRQAYIELAKIYHPDRYATVTLPVEVTDYLSAMARRINAAYAALDAKQPSGARKPAAAGAPPR